MTRHSRYLAVMGLGMMLAAYPAWSDPPPWAGGKGGQPREERAKQPPGKEGHAARQGFTPRDRDAVRGYYAQRMNCPPGLAKKNNGCLPPGQARKWNVGETLPKETRWLELPPELARILGAADPDHRYVQVASDILKIAVAGNRVVDAILDLGQR
ncbi:MAG: hypothetical protein HQL96_17105 [Magnetococcales bacterium]|nr:hypothetical protein [Magnetococcales bacterium]